MRFLNTLIVFSILAFCMACQSTDQPADTAVTKATDPSETPEEIDEQFVAADRLYKENCTSCHENRMTAFIDRDWKNGKAWNKVYQSIEYGHAFMDKSADLSQLPDSAVVQLTDYILGSIEKKRNEAAGVEPDYEDVVTSEDLNFRAELVMEDLEIPWGIAQLPNGDLLVTDRNGKFYRQPADGGVKIEIGGVPPVKFVEQGGLLDVAVHPDFSSNQTIYLTYSKFKQGNEGEATTALLMAQLNNDQLTNAKDIMVALPYTNGKYHYGSRIVFDNAGHLYVSVGDRANRDVNPQDLSLYAGKIHRFNLDGSIPTDNPFVNTPDAIPSIWTYGNRNPQGMVYDTKRNLIWESEHAPRGGDEINIVRGGVNYGWPVISYGINYNGTRFTSLTEKDGMAQPEFYYLPSTGTCGLTVVNSAKYPDWQGDLLAGSLRYRYLSRLKMDGQKVVGEERLLENIGRLRSVIMGNDGYIYIGVEAPGRVYRLVPAEVAS